jgi:hypothetical protein
VRVCVCSLGFPDLIGARCEPGLERVWINAADFSPTRPWQGDARKLATIEKPTNELRRDTEMPSDRGSV